MEGMRWILASSKSCWLAVVIWGLRARYSRTGASPVRILLTSLTLGIIQPSTTTLLPPFSTLRPDAQPPQALCATTGSTYAPPNLKLQSLGTYTTSASSQSLPLRASLSPPPRRSHHRRHHRLYNAEPAIDTPPPPQCPCLSLHARPRPSFLALRMFRVFSSKQRTAVCITLLLRCMCLVGCVFTSHLSHAAFSASTTNMELYSSIQRATAAAPAVRGIFFNRLCADPLRSSPVPAPNHYLSPHPDSAPESVLHTAVMLLNFVIAM
ncbi:hypothetical protein C8F01DRAFT_1112992 [Mycena amicta]|nr:hypothetical protein C8F01DRAFT_1112992 [Mycena amicta]